MGIFRDVEMGTVEVRGCDLDGNLLPPGVIRSYPVYGCGHCSNQVVMRPNRTRERRKCLQCGRLICEKSEICNKECTPIYAMFEDRFEGAGRWRKNVDALMSGITTFDEAQKMGLLG